MWVLGVVLLLVLPGCTRIERLVTGGPKPTMSLPEVPREMRGGYARAAPTARVSVEGGTALPEMGASGPGAAAAMGFTPDEDIVWTDPDDPDAPLPGMEETLAAIKKTGPWEISFSVATKIAMREGRPLLVWFTDTQRSPLCKFLSGELFSTPAFESWAGEHLVRLRLDFNVKGESEDERLRKEAYLKELKQRYKANGLPLVLVMAPDGTVTGRYKGYKRGEPEFYFGRLKSAAKEAERHQETWLEKMGERGYRTWTGRQGNTIFARLLRYREGELLLVEPDGRKFRAREKNLSDGDRLWIQGQKARRGR